MNLIRRFIDNGGGYTQVEAVVRALAGSTNGWCTEAFWIAKLPIASAFFTLNSPDRRAPAADKVSLTTVHSREEVRT